MNRLGRLVILIGVLSAMALPALASETVLASCQGSSPALNTSQCEATFSFAGSGPKTTVIVRFRPPGDGPAGLKFNGTLTARVESLDVGIKACPSAAYSSSSYCSVYLDFVDGKPAVMSSSSNGIRAWSSLDVPLEIGSSMWTVHYRLTGTCRHPALLATTSLIACDSWSSSTTFATTVLRPA